MGVRCVRCSVWTREGIEYHAFNHLDSFPDVFFESLFV